MLDATTIEAIADELVEAGRSRTPVPRLSARYPEMTVEDSYAVQQLWRRRNEEAGRKLVGRKIGLTSRAMQAATGITEPDYGAVFDDMVLETGCAVRWEQYTHPRVEVELAFVLKQDLSGPGCTIFDVLNATDYVVPALEILDSRIEMEGRTIVDTIADNAAMGAMVVGGNPSARTPSTCAGSPRSCTRTRPWRRRGWLPASWTTRPPACTGSRTRSPPTATA